MIGRFNREQRKLIYSLGANMLTRIPGAVGLLWFLPLLHIGLGTDGYATLLSAMALGTAVAFLPSGTNLIGRRLIGEAYSRQDQQGEADGFISTLLVNTLTLALTVAVIATYCWLQDPESDIFWVAAFVASSLFLAMFDNARSAYNEHYVTASMLLGIQILIYLLAFLIPGARQNVIIGAVVLQGPYLFTSLATVVLLLQGRPYLLRGRPRSFWLVLRQGTMFAMADGFLMATLSLAVVWMQVKSSPPTAAWFATVVRLFQTFLVPVIILLLPLSSYIRMIWNGKSLHQQRNFTKITLGIGLAYGALVSISLSIASQLYVAKLLHLPVPSSWPIFILFGAIIAYKTYSQIAYVVFDEMAHLSSWTTAVVGIAVVIGVAASFKIELLPAINAYAVVAGCAMIVVLFWNAARFISPSTKVANG